MSLHTCRHHSLDAVLARQPKRAQHHTIDMHCHCLCLAVEPMVADTVQKRAEMATMVTSQGEDSARFNRDVMLPKAFPKLISLEERINDMDVLGIDIQVLSPSPTQYYYWADQELSETIVTAQNTYVAEQVEKAPTRLKGLGTLSIQHPSLAVEQVHYATKTLGLKGFQISTQIGSIELDSPEFYPIWQACEETKAVVFIHPLGSSLGARITPYYLSNIIGQPIETTIALSKLILSGTLDKYPQLKLLAAHGGGYLPTYIGRTDHGYGVRPETACGCLDVPSHYLKRIWFDSLVYESSALKHLIDQVGASQVVIGTDYPFDMGAYDAHELIDSLDVSDEIKAAILGKNAANLLDLPTN